MEKTIALSQRETYTPNRFTSFYGGFLLPKKNWYQMRLLTETTIK